MSYYEIMNICWFVDMSSSYMAHMAETKTRSNQRLLWTCDYVPLDQVVPLDLPEPCWPRSRDPCLIEIHRQHVHWSSSGSLCILHQMQSQMISFELTDSLLIEIQISQANMKQKKGKKFWPRLDMRLDFKWLRCVVINWKNRIYW